MKFMKSLDILQEAEILIFSRDPSTNKLINFLFKHCLLPFKLVAKGVGIGIVDFFKFFLLYAALAYLVFLLIKSYPPESRNILETVFFPFIIIISMFLSLFPATSTYCTYGVKNSHVKIIAAILNKKNITKHEEIKTIKKNILIFENRVLTRTKTLRGLLAILWAVFLYFSSELRNNIFQASKSDFEIFTIFSFVVFLSFLAIEGYSKGTALLFKSILFSLHEWKPDDSSSLRNN